MLGGCCVLRCEGRADMSSLFLAGWRVAMAVCRPWFSHLEFASYYEMLASSVACFYLAAGL